jgi:hypothetical protein
MKTSLDRRRLATALLALIAMSASLAAIIGLVALALFTDRSALRSPVAQAAYVAAGVIAIITNFGGTRPLGVSGIALGLGSVPGYLNDALRGSLFSLPIVLIATFLCLLGMTAGVALVADRETRSHSSRVRSWLEAWPYAWPILVGFASTSTAMATVIFLDTAPNEVAGNVQLALASGVFISVVGILREDRRIAAVGGPRTDRPLDSPS